MWFLDVDTYALVFFHYERRPEYAILSHVWEGEEVLHADMKTSGARKIARHAKQRSFYKLDRACHQAKRDGFRYIWNDTCCINKESSAELQEAINSMFQWYKDAAVCYVYLADLSGEHVNRFARRHHWHGSLTALQHIGEDYTSTHGGSELGGNLTSTAMQQLKLVSGETTQIDRTYLRETKAALQPCRWFTRGWTLQELIAPRVVKFFDSAWCPIGYKASLLSVLEDITGIDAAVLQSCKLLARRSVATRMSWASQRTTTRVEDQAYSLMGIFDINMPMLYGEGQKAFIRLQEEIIKKSMDQSIFAWEDISNRSNEARSAGGVPLSRTQDTDTRSLLAPSPACFKNFSHLCYDSQPRFASYELNNKGLRITLPILKETISESGEQKLFASLNCYDPSTNMTEVIVLRPVEDHDYPPRRDNSGVYTVLKLKSTGHRARPDIQEIDAMKKKGGIRPLRHELLTIISSTQDTFEFFQDRSVPWNTRDTS